MTNKKYIYSLASALLGTYLSACSSGDIYQAPSKPLEPPPPYRALIKAAIEGKIEISDAEQPAGTSYRYAIPSAKFRKEYFEKLREMEVAAPEQELSDVGWAWKSCLRATQDGSKITMAFFLRQNRVLDVRSNVQIDCVGKKYEPL